MIYFSYTQLFKITQQFNIDSTVDNRIFILAVLHFIRGVDLAFHN